MSNPYSDDLTRVRMEMTKVTNSFESPRAALEAEVGQVWDTDELSRDFTVTGFLAPFVGVTRKSDGVRGTLTFQHHPRFYWGFKAE